MTEPFEEHDDHEAPEHTIEAGPFLGWSAKDVSDDELVDDDWIKQNTQEV